MSDVADVSAFWSLLLDQVVLAGFADWVMAGNLLRKLSCRSSHELESLDKLVLGSVKLRVDLALEDVGWAVEFANDKAVAGFSGVVGVVVVDAVGQWLQVVTSVEELGDVGTSGSLDDELATWMVWSVVSSVKDQVVKQEKVSLSTSSNGVKLILGDDGEWVDETDVLAGVDLVAHFHDDQGNEEQDWGHDPQVEVLVAPGVVGVDA